VAKTCSHHSFQPFWSTGGLSCAAQAGLPLLSTLRSVSTTLIPALCSAEKIVLALPGQVLPAVPDHQ